MQKALGKICNLFASVLVCLIGVWCLCLHGPPHGYFFLCKNGTHLMSFIWFNSCQPLAKLDNKSLEIWCAVIAVQLYVALDIRIAVLSCGVRHRKVEMRSISMASFLYTAPICGVICSLVRLSVSENSFVDSCGCVRVSTSQQLGGVVAMATQLTRTLIINVLCQSGDSSELCRWHVL